MWSCWAARLRQRPAASNGHDRQAADPQLTVLSRLGGSGREVRFWPPTSAAVWYKGAHGGGREAQAGLPVEGLGYLSQDRRGGGGGWFPPPFPKNPRPRS